MFRTPSSSNSSHLNSTIPPEFLSLMSQPNVEWRCDNLHDHICRNCQPNSAFVYRDRMSKELKRLHPIFKAYAASLVFRRGWTPTMATETAKMRQSAAARVAVEERQLGRDREDEEFLREVERAQSRRDREARQLARDQRRRAIESEEHERELARDRSRRAGVAAAAAIAAQTAANLASMENQDDDVELQLGEEDLEGLYYSDDDEADVHDEEEEGGNSVSDEVDGTDDHLEMEYEGETTAGVMVGDEFITARYDSTAVPPRETQNEGVNLSRAPPSGGATDP